MNSPTGTRQKRAAGMPQHPFVRKMALTIAIQTALVGAIIPSAAHPVLAAGEHDSSKTQKAGKPAPSTKNKPSKTTKSTNKAKLTMDGFLDRLMLAESGGNDRARNPLSTATGPYQFIRSTFLSVMRRHFPKRIEKLNTQQILALRTNRAIAREAAKAYTRDNATHLAAAGHKPTFPHLRLAFLMGSGGAIRILDAKPATPMPALVTRRVIRANPWMAKHTAQSLIARAARDVSLSPASLAGAEPYRDPVTGKLIVPSRRISRKPRIRVRCNLARPSCKRWLALKSRSLRNQSKRRTKKSLTRRSKQ